MDLGDRLIPLFYRSWALNALQSKRHDLELILDLVRVRDDHAHVAAHQDELLKKYDTDELRGGREEIIETVKTSRDHCRKVADDVGEIIRTLESFAK